MLRLAGNQLTLRLAAIQMMLRLAAIQRDNRGMRGDSVEIVIDAGAGVRTYEITATRAGRRVEVSYGRGFVEVTEVTRGGTPVRTGRFMSGRVLAVVEHPAGTRASATGAGDAEIH